VDVVASDGALPLQSAAQMYVVPPVAQMAEAPPFWRAKPFRLGAVRVTLP
jgi:hypothetical protein